VYRRVYISGVSILGDIKAILDDFGKIFYLSSLIILL
jgi:hypothetical protein